MPSGVHIASLHPRRSGWAFARLRGLRGEDERTLGSGPAALEILSLLRRLLVDGEGGVPSELLEELPLADRDRVAAAVYARHFGDAITAQAPCTACTKGFETNFSLAALMRYQSEQAAAAVAPGAHATAAQGPDEEGAYSLPDGRRFRLPTAADQRELIMNPARDAAALLRQRCVLRGDPHSDPGAIDAAMERVGPLLDLEFEARCPNCEQEQSVHFEICSFLLASLRQQAPWLAREVHVLARAYGWSLASILELPIEERRGYVRLIGAEYASARRQP